MPHHYLFVGCSSSRRFEAFPWEALKSVAEPLRLALDLWMKDSSCERPLCVSFPDLLFSRDLTAAKLELTAAIDYLGEFDYTPRAYRWVVSEHDNVGKAFLLGAERWTLAKRMNAAGAKWKQAAEEYVKDLGARFSVDGYIPDGRIAFVFQTEERQFVHLADVESYKVICYPMDFI